MTKPVRLVRPVKKDQPGHPHSLIRVFFTDCIFFFAYAFNSLQAIQRGKNREPLPHWVDEQADLSLAGYTALIVGFVERLLKWQTV